MVKKRFEVSQTINITVDESKFTEEFMEEYRKDFYPFYDLEDHLKHLCQLYARGICDETDFVEGYGPLKNFGVEFSESFLEVYEHE